MQPLAGGQVKGRLVHASPLLQLSPKYLSLTSCIVEKELEELVSINKLGAALLKRRYPDKEQKKIESGEPKTDGVAKLIVDLV